VARLRNARATSAGGVVVRTQGDQRQLVLGRRTSERERVTWSLPKGTPSGDETIDQTALREVSEETGLRVRIVAPLGEIHYWFVRRGVRFAKTVHYYLMESTGGDLADHDHEFEAVEWIDFEDLPRLDLFPTERDLIGRAEARLDELEDRVAS
jgi:8-oxo-dGTP pyrophosphatase MutT (NUDIX family)